MYFITISEKLGTNGEKIARKVAEELKYSFIGKEELEKTATEIGFLSDVRKVDDEKSPPVLERFFSEKPKIYIERMQSAIYEIAKKGNAVFLGRGSTFLLHSFDCALHVLVTGSLGRRTERVMEEKQVGKEVAEKIIQRSDQDKKGFLRFAFDKDWLNPDLYDLILNTDKLSVNCAAKIIIDAAGSDEIKACGIEAVKGLGRLSLLRRIESSILETGIDISHVFVEVEDTNSVQLYGFVYSREEKEEIEKVMKKFGEIKRVRNDLVVTPASV